MNPQEPQFLKDADHEITALIETLLATEERLAELTAGEVDTVAGRDGQTFMLRRAQDQLRAREAEKQAAMLAELKHESALLLESRQRLSIATESAHIGIWDWNIFADKMVWDARMYEMYGIRDQDFGGAYDAWQKAIHPDDRERMEGEIAAAVAGLKEFHSEFHIVWPNGEVRQIEAHGVVRRATNGAVAQMIGVNWDITERKRLEMERERFFSISLDLICIVNLDGLFQRVNPAFQKTLGYTPEEICGKLLTAFIHPDDHAATLAEIERIGAGAVTLNFENRYRCKDGSYRLISWTAAIFSEDGTLYGVGRDITQQRKLEEQLRQSQKMEAFGQLAGGVAHDFNNILAIITIQVSLLKSEGNLSQSQQNFANGIDEASVRAANLTRQLLMFSRRQILLQQRDLDLNNVIVQIGKMLQRVLGDDIQIQFKYAPHPLFIHADSGMLDQVLMNLAVNSRDAMPQGGQLIIETSVVKFDAMAVAQSPEARIGSFACLTVTDTGTGISLENKSRIFEPFFTTKEVGKGTGLGLATVFGIVQQHQGWINVYSEIGHGTTMRIYLPWLANMTAQKNVEKILAVPTYAGTEVILLVEDDSALRVAVQLSLSRLGYRVLEARNGVEAMAVGAQYSKEIGLLLTDMVMPGGVSGRTLGKRLSDENPKLKIIYTSGYSAEVASKDFPLEEGVNFLIKPFQAQKLAQIVRAILDT